MGTIASPFFFVTIVVIFETCLKYTSLLFCFVLFGFIHEVDTIGHFLLVVQCWYLEKIQVWAMCR